MTTTATLKVSKTKWEQWDGNRWVDLEVKDGVATAGVSVSAEETEVILRIQCDYPDHHIKTLIIEDELKVPVLLDENGGWHRRWDPRGFAREPGRRCQTYKWTITGTFCDDTPIPKMKPPGYLGADEDMPDPTFTITRSGGG